MPLAYYNEHDAYAAQWLRNLIAGGHIAPGDVDERSIVDVRPDDLRGYDQCHFFAGIGGWSIALRRAGWPDDRPVWTGSCPCQPFSVAGKGSGTEDERHLWPAFFELIRERRPLVVLGEQVASKDALHWLDAVCADLEGAGYAVGAVDTCGAGFGAPHIRQRLYWVADADIDGRNQAGLRLSAPGNDGPVGDGSACGLADASSEGPQGGGSERAARPGREGRAAERNGEARGMELAGSIGRQRREATAPGHDDDREASFGAQGEYGAGISMPHRDTGPARPTNGHWRDADWLLCRDGKWRPVSPGTQPLAHGAPSRSGRLRAYGNCIVIDQAAEFVAAYRSLKCC